ncbi:MAG TPA: PIN domain nuclease [Actinophytocola sp.]|uniref:PIN domain nuclease n=1 Tax=Actinophytocola sp. TaxID=1872138 RepID=UPI002DB58BFC|nr:PIN domain nuclease [Actinophytocola sp.]HEU5470345.1 PIN domain nuclease [Actinophytocola sp.]
MALSPLYLVDKSAIARMHLEQVRAVLEPLLLHGRLATCAITDLEVLFSARNADEYQTVLAERRNYYTQLPITPEVCSRAVDTQRRLARHSRHRGAGVSDLLIAACAERHGVSVLHYDADFDLIASATGQPTRWVVPQGAVP